MKLLSAESYHWFIVSVLSMLGDRSSLGFNIDVDNMQTIVVLFGWSRENTILIANPSCIVLVSDKCGTMLVNDNF